MVDQGVHFCVQLCKQTRLVCMPRLLDAESRMHACANMQVMGCAGDFAYACMAVVVTCDAVAGTSISPDHVPCAPIRDQLHDRIGRWEAPLGRGGAVLSIRGAHTKSTAATSAKVVPNNTSARLPH